MSLHSKTCVFSHNFYYLSLLGNANLCLEMGRSTNMVSSDCGLKKVSSEAVTCNLSTKLPHCPEDSTDRKNFNKGARGNWREKAVEKGKTKYLWTNEIKNIPSEGKKGEPTGRGPVSSNPKYGPSIYSKRSYPTRSTRSGNTKNNASVQEVKGLFITSRNYYFYVFGLFLQWL